MLTMEFDYNEALKVREEEATERGRQEGRQQGLQKGRYDTLLLLLSKKFNFIPIAYQQKLALLEQDQLDRILDDIFDLHDIGDLDKYITNV